MHEFADEFGAHSHNVSVPGRAYDPKAAVTCEACVNRLTTKIDAWQDELTRRHNLSEGFWKGYKRGWEK